MLINLWAKSIFSRKNVIIKFLVAALMKLLFYCARISFQEESEQSDNYITYKFVLKKSTCWKRTYDNSNLFKLTKELTIPSERTELP